VCVCVCVEFNARMHAPRCRSPPPKLRPPPWTLCVCCVLWGLVPTFDDLSLCEQTSCIRTWPKVLFGSCQFRSVISEIFSGKRAQIR